MKISAESFSFDMLIHVKPEKIILSFMLGLTVFFTVTAIENYYIHSEFYNEIYAHIISHRDGLGNDSVITVVEYSLLNAVSLLFYAAIAFLFTYFLKKKKEIKKNLHRIMWIIILIAYAALNIFIISMNSVILFDIFSIDKLFFSNLPMLEMTSVLPNAFFYSVGIYLMYKVATSYTNIQLKNQSFCNI